MTEGTELSNQEKIKMRGEKKTYKSMGILEVDSIKQAEMKEKLYKEYLIETRKLLETKLFSRNLIKGIKVLDVSLVRDSGPREELQQLDKRTRKLLTMRKVLYPKDDADRLYVLRKEGGRELTSIEDSVNVSIHRLKDCLNIFMISKKVKKSNHQRYKNWSVDLSFGGKIMTEIKIQRQYSLLLFVIAIILLNYLLRKNEFTNLYKSQKKVNHLM